MKKIVIITTLLLILITSQVSAFELVNEKPTSKKFCLGAEAGLLSDIYYGISGNYNLNQQVSIQTLVGQITSTSDEDSSSTENNTKLLVTGKGIYRLTNNLDYDFYLFGIAGKMKDGINIGAGAGTEFNTLSLPTNVRYKTEIGLLSTSNIMINMGIKLYF